MTAPKNILTHTVDIDVDGGTTMRGYVARPTGPGPYPGVVVAMELFGVSAHVREVCEQLADLGFVALAPDLYHRTAPGVELAEDAAGRERGFQLLHQQTREQVLRDIAAAITRLRTDGSAAVGMVGLSVGGHVAYLAATVPRVGARRRSGSGSTRRTDNRRPAACRVRRGALRRSR